MQAFVARIEQSDKGLAVFFSGCDFRCPICNTPEMLTATEEQSVDLRELRRQVSGAGREVVFTGGEPCLQRQALLNLCAYAREHGLKVRLETNGSKTGCLQSLLAAKALDSIALDLKAPLDEQMFERATCSKTFFKTTASLIADLKASLQLLRRHQDIVDIEIRTTVAPNLVFKKEHLLEMAKELQGLECTWVLQQFQQENVRGRFASIKPPSTEFLEHLRDAVQSRYSNLRIIVDSAPA